MRILFDQGTPVPLRDLLSEHHVETAFERGWHVLENGALLDAAEANQFEVLVTTDQNLRYQQNLAARRLAVLVLLTTDWRLIRQHGGNVAAVVATLRPGDYRELAFPSRP